MTAIDTRLLPTPAPARRPLVGRLFSRTGEAPSPLHLLLSAGLYLFFAVFLLWPLWQIVSTGFQRKDGSLTFLYARLVFADPVLRAGLWHAAGVALAVVVLTLAVALPLAVLSTRYEFPGRRLLSGLLLVPLVLPPFVGALGMRLVLGRFGPLTQLLRLVGPGDQGIDWLGHYPLVGIVIVESLHLYPILLLNLQAALANLDPAMEQAAANLGASRWTVFRRVTLPLIRPGLFAGGTLVLIWSFTELGTPLIFDYETIAPVQVFRQINEISTNHVPYALVIVMLLASVLMYAVGKILLGRGFDAATTKASVAAASRKLTGWRAAAAAAPFAFVFLLAVLPHVSVVLTSLTATGRWYRSALPQQLTLGHYGQALLDDLVLPSVWNSIRYASMATLLAVLIGLAAAVVIVRSNVPGRGLIDALTMLPLAVPGVVLAFGYLSLSVWLKQKYPAALGPRGGLHFLDVQEAPLVLLVIAYAARRMPYVVRSAVAGLQQTPRDLELAGANLGAGRLTVLRRITLPLILASLIAGGLLAFAFAMLEVGDSLLLAQRADAFPITKAILDLAQRLGDGLYIASALGVWAMVLLTLTILASNALLGRKLGAAFRV